MKVHTFTVYTWYAIEYTLTHKNTQEHTRTHKNIDKYRYRQTHTCTCTCRHIIYTIVTNISQFIKSSNFNLVNE